MQDGLEVTGNLFHNPQPPRKDAEGLGEGAVLLHGFALDREADLYGEVCAIARSAPFRHMSVRGGHQMSVAMTNCGQAGWISDETGYRYDAIDPLTSEHWPPMPPSFTELAVSAAELAGFGGFTPDACLINRYEPGARMGLHQDKNEQDYDAPIVSVSLGLPATFLFGGLRRNDRPGRFGLISGDVIVWGGPARLFYHGVAPLKEGNHPVTGRVRINLTFRNAL